MIAARRFEDWPARLAAWVETARRTPFAWGAHDCGLAACDAVLAMTGMDHGADYRGRYSTAAGAAKALKRVAGGGLEAAAGRAWGEPLPSPKLAQRGDVVLIDTPLGPALGVCIGAQVAAAAPEGLTWLPLGRAMRAWRI